ncbi:MAG: type II toxin-antitoxin system HicB family antitoxin [Ruminococcus sp.]|nr:type II toxin-antitoxin system HicB family antitoxin [Ruminococcus sp.]MCM1479064.1 type II toxin-antitoxin system HicB family antitoxin [Muribaculaceae bacterium]
MKACYPVILNKCDDGSGYLVTIPDFDNNTFGKDVNEAIFMARDAVNLLCLTYEEEKWDLPAPSEISEIKTENESDIVTLVDADTDEYRRMLDNRAVRKNCTIPSWLNDMAVKANINFSATLQNALKEQLNIR